MGAADLDAAMNISAICSSLTAGGYSVKFRGFSAIDRYLGLPALPFLWAETNADIAVLARFIDNLRFPGAEISDAAVDTPEGTCYFRCLDSDEPEYIPKKENDNSFPLLSFGYDCQTRHFLDPLGVYPQLRAFLKKSPQGAYYPAMPDSLLRGDEDVFFEQACCTGSDRYRIIMEASLLLSRYNYETLSSTRVQNLAAALRNSSPEFRPGLPALRPGPEAERVFLSSLLVSSRPDLGLEFLKRSGFLEELWPELAAFEAVDHSKEFHPEGNVWNHTLETFRYRKAISGGAFDLRLSMGLLLHDAGKPISASIGSRQGNRRFNGHAELGARAAAQFLERLEFEPSFVSDIFYLVKNHMLPAALKRLPLTKTSEIMASPLFPVLMELYRCDESSSFKGLDGYYENSAAYQTFLKNKRNPYRSADGRKIGKRKIYSH